MTIQRASGVILAMVTLLAASPALAHAGSANGLVSGIAHPLFAADHLIAMLCLGVWSARVDAARPWLMPAVFLGAMATGMLVGLVVTPPAGTDALVAASVVVLGVILGLGGPRGPVWPLVIAGAIGLIHGVAHGGEIAGSAVLTLPGMLVGSAVLLAVGHGIGRLLVGRPAFMQPGGAGIVAAGLLLFLMA